MKTKVYEPPPGSLQQMKDRISHVCQQLNDNMFRATMNAMLPRCRMYVQSGGRHGEGCL